MYTERRFQHFRSHAQRQRYSYGTAERNGVTATATEWWKPGITFTRFIAVFVGRRSATAPQAEVNAGLHGGVGYHYPSESGTSGADVTPGTCPAGNPRCHWNRLFVTAGVSYAIRLYYSMTRDYDYMVNSLYAGCDVSKNIAKFLTSQAVYNPENGRYDINGTHSSIN